MKIVWRIRTPELAFRGHSALVSCVRRFDRTHVHRRQVLRARRAIMGTLSLLFLRMQAVARLSDAYECSATWGWCDRGNAIAVPDSFSSVDARLYAASFSVAQRGAAVAVANSNRQSQSESGKIAAAFATTANSTPSTQRGSSFVWVTVEGKDRTRGRWLKANCRFPCGCKCAVFAVRGCIRGEPSVVGGSRRQTNGGTAKGLPATVGDTQAPRALAVPVW